MAYRGSSSDERLRAARAADRERDQLKRVLAELASDLEAEETRNAEHERLLEQKLSDEERELVIQAHEQIEPACKELRAQITRLTARRDSLAEPARDLPDARAERTAMIAHTPHGKAALELIVRLGELDSMTRQIAEAIQTGLLLGDSVRENLIAGAVTPWEARDSAESDSGIGLQMRSWIANVRGAIGIVRADLAVFRRELAALGIEFDPVMPTIPDGTLRYLVVEPSTEVVSAMWGPISGLSTDVATQVGKLRKRAADVEAEITAVEDECDRLLLV